MERKERSPGPWLDPPVVSSPGLSWETYGHWKVRPQVWHSMAPLGVFPSGLVTGEKGNHLSPPPASKLHGLTLPPPPSPPAEGSPSPKLMKTKMHSIPLKTKQRTNRVLLDR